MLINQAETAIDSFHAHRNQGKAHRQRERILEFIEARSARDWSIGEIAHALGLEKSTVSARVNELLYESKQIIEAPKRRDLMSGKTVRPVTVPRAGQLGLF